MLSISWHFNRAGKNILCGQKNCYPWGFWWHFDDIWGFCKANLKNLLGVNTFSLKSILNIEVSLKTILTRKELNIHQYNLFVIGRLPVWKCQQLMCGVFCQVKGSGTSLVMTLKIMTITYLLFTLYYKKITFHPSKLKTEKHYWRQHFLRLCVSRLCFLCGQYRSKLLAICNK